MQFTGLLVIVGFLQALFTWFSVKLTKQSADAATSAAKTAREALVSTERGALSAVGIVIAPDGDEIHLGIRLQNTGRTAVKELNVSTGFYTGEGLPPEPIYQTNTGEVRSELAPDKTIVAIIKQDIKGRYGTGMHFFCRATYKDVFDTMHETRAIVTEGGFGEERYNLASIPNYERTT